jgi:hypothetical protein
MAQILSYTGNGAACDGRIYFSRLNDVSGKKSPKM